MSKPEDEDMLAATPLESSTMDEQPLELSAGDRLKQARLARQFELRDVAEQTRQSQDTLAALESMQTAHIAPSILRLQAKSYARFLGLPENEIASAFAEGRGSINTEAMPTHAPPVARSRKPVLIGAGFLGLAVLAIGGVSLLMQPSPQDDADPLAISARLAPAFANVTEVSSLSASVEESFSIRATKRAWIEVRGSDGTVFRNREMAVGESYFPRTGAGWTITVRDGAAFEWRLGDLVVEPVGEPQEALYSVSVDSALAAANTARSAALAQAPGGFDAPR
jgi:cytoskeleton protein RodZ